MPYARIYVDSDNGNDANDGLSWATAKQTISSGIAARIAGGYIGAVFCKGNFSEQIITNDPPLFAETHQIVGVSGATIDVGSGIRAIDISSSSPFINFYDFAISGQPNYLNTLNGTRGSFFNSCTLYTNGDYIFNNRSQRGGTFINCTFIGNSGEIAFYNGSSAFIDCSFYKCGISQPRNTDLVYRTYNSYKASLVNTKFTDVSSPMELQNYKIEHCSFHNCYSLESSYQDRIPLQYSNCVFSNDVPASGIGQPYIKDTHQTFILGCYGYNTNLVFQNTGIKEYIEEYTTLTSPPYKDPSNGDWTLSAEMNNLVGDDGHTPGAVPASGGGGGGSFAYVN